MSRKEKPDPYEAERLFVLPEPSPALRIKPLVLPVWTESKAQLIQRYLQLFVRITKHGTYIDGFAGPQKPHIDEYAAKLVVETDPTTFYRSGEPARLRHFHLFEIGLPQIEVLHRLRESHPGRDVNVYHDDFNRKVDSILCPDILRPTEATFCLLLIRERSSASGPPFSAWRTISERLTTRLSYSTFLPTGGSIGRLLV